MPYPQPGGGMLATTAADGTTRLWDPIRGRLLATLAGSCRGWHRDPSRFLSFTGRDLTTQQLAGAVVRWTIDIRALGDRAIQMSADPERMEYSPDGRLIAVLGFTIAHGKIVAIDVLADAERLSRLGDMAG